MPRFNTNYIDRVLISPSAKLDYTIIKGSPEKRKSLASKLNAKLFVLINDTFEKRAANGEAEFITKDELHEHFNKVCKKYVNIQLEKNNDQNCGGWVGDTCHVDEFKNSEGLVKKTISIDGFIVCLPFKDLNDKLVLKNNDIGIIMHEFRHVFDRMTAPKDRVISRITAFYQPITNAIKFYSEYVYNLNRPCYEYCTLKQIVNSYLKNVSCIDVITILKHWKNDLITEKNAYEDANFYSNKINSLKLKKRIGKGLDATADYPSFRLKFDDSNYSTKAEKQVAFSKFCQVVKETLYSKYIYKRYELENKICLMNQLLEEVLKQKRN